MERDLFVEMTTVVRGMIFQLFWEELSRLE